MEARFFLESGVGTDRAIINADFFPQDEESIIEAALAVHNDAEQSGEQRSVVG